MNVELIIAIAVIIILAWVIISHRIHQHQEALNVRDQILEDSEVWKQKNQQSFQEIQSRKKKLQEFVKQKISAETPEREELLKTLEDWADVKIQSFKDRRTWIRKPDKNG